MKNFIVSEETEELVGLEITEGAEPDLILLRDIDTIDNDPNEYYVLRSDIPKLIEGLKLFMENKE